MAVRLDNIVRTYIKERDGQCCRVCGIHKLSTHQKTIDWSHKISRSNYLLRWNEKNSLAMCRRCHDDWGKGITKPMNSAIDSLWGEGTSDQLEVFATRNSFSKGTNLDSVDYRLKLEKFYKEKTKHLQSGNMTAKESMENLIIWGIDDQ